MSRQLNLLPKPTLEHGGDVHVGKRKLMRPFDPKRPLHVVLRSARARGAWSLLHPRNKGRIFALKEALESKYRVRVYSFSNVGNHLHFLVKAPDRASFQGFLRELAGQIAFRVTGAKKGKPVGRFWEKLVYSRVIGWGQEFEKLKTYLSKNLLEGLGISREGLNLMPVIAFGGGRGG